MEPRVSVVMPVRNAEAFLGTAIEQLQSQTLTEYEVLVVDDASEDATPRLLHRWAQDDDRVVLLRNDVRQGVAASRNNAVSRARGDYIWFTDCDDQWSPKILECLYAEAVRCDADVVVCGARVRRTGQTDGGTIPGPQGPPVANPTDAVRRLLRREIQGHLWNKLFRRSLFEDIRFPPTRAFSDLGAMGPLLAAADRVTLLDEPLYTYVLRPGSILNSPELRARDLLDCREVMRGVVAGLPPSPDLDRDFLRFEYSSVYIPTLHELIRRDARDGDARAVREEIQKRMRLSETVRLASGGQWRSAAAAVGLKYAFFAYASAYAAFRRLKWGSVGYGSR